MNNLTKVSRAEGPHGPTEARTHNRTMSDTVHNGVELHNQFLHSDPKDGSCDLAA